MENTPSCFFTTLRDCGALVRILPELDALFGVSQRADFHPEIDCGIHTMMVVDDAARHGYVLEVRFAALMHDLGKATTPPDILPSHHDHEERGVDILRELCGRLRVPADCRDLGLLAARHHGSIHRAFELRSETIVDLFQKADAWRKPERFEQLLQACASDKRGRAGHESDDYPQAPWLLELMRLARGVDAGAIASECANKATIPERVRRARIAAIKPKVNERRNTKGLQ